MFYVVGYDDEAYRAFEDKDTAQKEAQAISSIVQESIWVEETPRPVMSRERLNEIIAGYLGF